MTVMQVEQTARRFRQARLTRGYSVPELSRRSGVSERTIFRIEAGDFRRSPLIENVAAIADALGCKPGDLLVFEEAA